MSKFDVVPKKTPLVRKLAPEPKLIPPDPTKDFKPVKPPAIPSAPEQREEEEKAGNTPNVAVAVPVGRPSIAGKVAEMLEGGINSFVVAQTFDALSAERETFEKTEQLAAHKRLTALLGEAYCYHYAMKKGANAARRKALDKELNEFLQRKGFKVISSTTDAGRCIKGVWGDAEKNRQRDSAYAKVLTIAMNWRPEAITPDKFAQWMFDQGGVENIRRQDPNKTNAETPEEKRKKTQGYLQSHVEAICSKPAAWPMDADDGDKILTLIVTYRPTGEFEMHAVVKAESAINSALDAYYKDHVEAIKSFTAPPPPPSAVEIALAETVEA